MERLKKNKNVLIIGSGLTGAVLAYKHKCDGDNVTVFEKRNHIGGNVYTKDVEGICVHQYGAHIFHTSDKKVWKFVNQFVHFNDYRHQVKSRYKGKLYSLPINMNTFKEFYGVEKKEDVTEEMLQHIYETLFYGYSAKQWGKPVEEIDKEVFKRLPVRYTFNNDYFDDIYQGIPIEGYTYLIEQLLLGSTVILNCDVKNDYNFSKYDIVYNTGPIDRFLDYMLGSLEYRSLEFKTEVYSKGSFQECAVVNEAMIEVPYTRTIEHKYFNDTGQQGTIITREFPKKYNGKNEPYYTVNTERNQVIYDRYKRLAKLKYPNMIFCGRLGDYKYYDMDDAVREALNIFKKNKEAN